MKEEKSVVRAAGPLPTSEVQAAAKDMSPTPVGFLRGNARSSVLISPDSTLNLQISVKSPHVTQLRTLDLTPKAGGEG